MPGPMNIQHHPPGNSQDVRIEGMFATVVVTCPCGSRKPVMVPVLPGGGSGAECGRCKVVWRVDKIEYEEVFGNPGDEPLPLKLKIRVQGIVPKIMTVGAMAGLRG